jgi:phosphoribosyl 1,2-cyclic phosphodiesterase
LQIELCGVRGSLPAAGIEYVRYGGHTSCVAVQPDGAPDPTLVLDAGTGLRTLTGQLSTSAFHGAIVLSHLHWDHVQGIPFFAAGDRHASVVDVYLPAQRGETARQLLTRMMSPPLFPIEPGGLNGEWSFHALEAGWHEIGGFKVRTADLAHKGGRTFGYRIEDGSGSVAYLPDHGPVQGCSDDARALVDGVDVLFHDAQFLEPERVVADAYGHATVGDAIELAVQAGVRLLVLFHHSPVRTDDQLDEIAAGISAPMQVVLAREGQVLDIPIALEGPEIAAIAT